MISVVKLSKMFHATPRDVVAVEQLTFTVAAGEVYGLLGANGAGKTTTLRMILGLLQPTSGYAEVAGRRTDQDPDGVKQRIGFVSTSAGLYQWLTPREMLLFFADLYGVAAEAAEEKIDRLGRLFGMQEYLERPCGTLSAGQRQRVNLARALVHDPPVLMLDEPTRGLDVLGSKVIFDFIRDARQAGRAVVLCTHRLEEAERICDRFGLLHRGQLFHEGTLSELQGFTGCDSLMQMFLKLMPDGGEDVTAA